MHKQAKLRVAAHASSLYARIPLNNHGVMNSQGRTFNNSNAKANESAKFEYSRDHQSIIKLSNKQMHT